MTAAIIDSVVDRHPIAAAARSIWSAPVHAHLLLTETVSHHGTWTVVYSRPIADGDTTSDRTGAAESLAVIATRDPHDEPAVATGDRIVGRLFSPAGSNAAYLVPVAVTDAATMARRIADPRARAQAAA